MADAAFSELDAGELRFALAEAGVAGARRRPVAHAGARRNLEEQDPPKSSFTKTLPPPWMGELEPQPDLGPLPAPSISFSAPPVPTISRMTEALSPGPTVSEPPDRSPVAPPAEDRDLAAGAAAPAVPAATRPWPGIRRAWSSCRPRMKTGQAFAVRLDALRVVSGSASTRVLHRRTREAETSEVLGGLGSPFVRVAGDAQLVLGARPHQRLALLSVEADLAFVREDLLVGFELALQYENGRVALEPAGRRGVGGGAVPRERRVRRRRPRRAGEPAERSGASP